MYQLPKVWLHKDRFSPLVRRSCFQKQSEKNPVGATIENIKSQGKAKLPKIRLNLDTIHKTAGRKGV